MTRSSSVLKTTASDCAVAPTVVITSVFAGTTTAESRTADNQKVRSVRATEGGKGWMPTMLRKCT